MASGDFIVTNAAFGNVTLSWYVVSQSMENNTTTIGYKLSIYRSSEIISSAKKNYWIKVDGKEIASGTNTIGGTGTKDLKTGTFTLIHEEDGTRTFTLSFSQEIGVNWAGNTIKTLTGNGEFTLEDIPKPTTPVLSRTTLEMDKKYSIVLNRKKDTFTHNLYFSFGTKSNVPVGTAMETGCNWTPPSETYAPEIPNSTEGTGTLTCVTYDEDGTLIGVKSLALILSVPETVVPTLEESDILVTETVGGLRSKFSAFVQSKSVPNIQINAGKAYGAEIKSYKTTFDGNTYHEQTFKCEKISGSGTMDVVVTVEDTRGRTATATKQIEVLPYSVPTITNLYAYRSTGINREEDPNSESITVKFEYSISSLGGKNEKSFIINCNETGTEEWTTLTSGKEYSLEQTVFLSNVVFNVDSTYTVKLTLYDYFGSTYRTVTIPTGFALIDFHRSGKGLAFGKVSELENVLDVGFKTKFTGGFVWPTLETETDLNFFTTSNKYTISSNNEYYNAPVAEVDAVFEVVAQGEIVQQRFSIVSKTNPQTFERVYNSEGWGAWIDVDAEIEKNIENTNTEISNIKEELEKLLLVVYPVGSVYISANKTSPENLFGGTWEQIEDVFLLASSSTHEAGTRGGSESYDLSIDEHSHTIQVQEDIAFTSGSYTSGPFDIPIVGTSNGAGGIEETIPTLPPYLSVYMWERTA